ncbi:MAG: M42 family metallopeptidase, partial [Gemmatimonadota bacterium]
VPRPSPRPLMQPRSLTFLKSLLDAPGPSSFETAPARLWRKEAESFADSVTADVSGNSFATLNAEAKPRVMFAGHIDEIGVMVTFIDDDGYLSFDGIGGWDHQVFVGQRVLLMGRAGPVTGVIGKRAIHLMEKDERDKVSKASDLWLDIGALNRAEAESRIRIGDPGVLASTVLEFPNGRIVSRSLDNRIGAFVVLEALRLLSKKKPSASITAVATTREEIGYTGGGARTSATHLDAQVAIVVDVTHATDYPGVEKRKHGDFKLGGGPVISRGASINPIVFDMLLEAAEAEKIPYSVEAAPRETHTDADAIFTAHRGIATALVSVPNRYMHSPNEMAALEDLDRTAQLLAAFARRVNGKTDFVPR